MYFVPHNVVPPEFPPLLFISGFPAPDEKKAFWISSDACAPFPLEMTTKMYTQTLKRCPY